MTLTNKQEQGLREAVQRHKNGERYTVISGYAGSGKSTLVRFIIEALDIPEDRICYATYTGKAAQVLLKKGNKNVSTLHKLLYKSVPQPDGSFIHIPVELIPYDLVIVDEVSMVPKKMLQQLIGYPNVHIICLGDPFQLEPVEKSEDNHVLDAPHVFLDEIMRQAQESAIIRITMDIRAGRKIHPGTEGEVMVVRKDELEAEMFEWADQIICATNECKDSINIQMKQMYGRPGDPQDGDKIICIHNDWDRISANGDPLINGTIGYLNNSFKTFLRLPAYIAGGNNGGVTVPLIHGDFISDAGGEFKSLDIDQQQLAHGQSSLDGKAIFRMRKSKKFQNSIPYQFNYGYAITCHKAQGSEWDKVLVIEENFPWSVKERARWLYTACTRASEKLVLRLKD